MKHLRVAALAAAILLGISAAPAQSAAMPPVSTFVVQSSFSSGSPIIDATGVWVGCTEVIDISGSANQISPRRVVFAGEKEVVCPDGNVRLQYDAELNFASADSSFGKTSGDWQIMWSDNASINGGGGSLRGTSRNCSDCIVDTFTGRVY